MMRLAQLRGVLAFALVAASIAYAWTTIENRATEEAGAAVTTTSTSTTTTVALTTTTTAEQATIAICERSQLFAAQSQIIPPDLGPGPLANLSLLFWRDIREVATPDAITEVVAIIDYYEDYLATAEPFEFDTVTIILEGDKEKFEQLVTRPAPGLTTMRGFVQFLCDVELPDQPSISASGFADLEDRLFDPPDT